MSKHEKPFSKHDELIDRHLSGELSESEKKHLVTLLDSDTEFRKTFVAKAQFDALLLDSLQNQSESAKNEWRIPANKLGLLSSRWTQTSLALASLIIVATALFFAWNPSQSESPIIATITGTNGPLQWTGDQGQVFRDLTVGIELNGGTIDGLSPESWFELKFNDGSKVTISGHSMLTFSDLGQKLLYLKGGTFSANVMPQPSNKPMLIHTRSAILEVLGTTFDVEAGLTSTVLNVNEGKVRINRIIEGDSIEVPAQHRAIAAANRDLSMERVPDSVSLWKSQIGSWAGRMYGQWTAAAENEPSKLFAIPYKLKDRKLKDLVLYTVGIPVTSGDQPPVVVQPDSQLRVEGELNTAHDVYFGMTMRDNQGEFAGRFQTRLKAQQFKSGESFKVVLNIEEYKLDPSLKHMQDKLPDSPVGLTIVDVWFHTLFDPSGLAITEVEMFDSEN